MQLKSRQKKSKLPFILESHCISKTDLKLDMRDAGKLFIILSASEII